MKLIPVIVLFAFALNKANCGIVEYVNTHMVFNKIQLEETAKMSKECKEESNLSDEVVAQLENGEVPDVREFKCFLKCFALKFGTLKPNGDMNLDTLEMTVRKKQYDIFATCSKVQGDDECQRMFDIFKCYINGLKKDNIVLRDRF